MRIAKTTVLALAVSAALAGPVLAQGASSGAAPSRGAMQGGGMSGSGDEEMEAQPTTPPQKSGVAAKTATRTGTKGTVGSGHATPPKAMGAEPSKRQ